MTEGLICWFVYRISARDAKIIADLTQSNADLTRKVKKIEEVLRENKLLEPETILFSRRTGA